MINKIKFDVDNANSYIGARVEFNFGAYYPRVYAVIKSSEIVPANSWYDAHVILVAACEDSGIEYSIKEFQDKGIGCRIVEMPHDKKSEAPKKKSPWSV